MVPFQREIHEIGGRHDIDPNAISYSHPVVTQGGDMVRFGANFPLQGGYEVLRSFIRDIEHSRNFLIIEAIELTKSREGGVILSLNIRVSTLFRDPDLLPRGRRARR